MKKNSWYFLTGLIAFNGNAQTWHDTIKDPANFYNVRNAFKTHLSLSASEESSPDEEINIQRKLFNRWENFMEQRVYPSGKLPQLTLASFNSSAASHKTTNDNSDWTSMEKDKSYPHEDFTGRINCIAFHPSDSNIVYVGAPAGGLWKTTDGGVTWTPLTDFLINIGVSDIIVDYTNPSIIYVSTGDKEIRHFISNPYTFGVIKSTDGGNTWDTTNLTFTVNEQVTIKKVMMHPTNHNILFATISDAIHGANKGIWKTTNGGTTWSKKSSGARHDIEFKPGNPSVMYATGFAKLYKSTNSGEAWSQITSTTLPGSSNVDDCRIAVTPKEPNALYIQYKKAGEEETYRLYKSKNAGSNWFQINSYSEVRINGYYFVFNVSPRDTSIIHIGGFTLRKSENGGITFINDDSGHLDYHVLEYRPDGKVYYCGSDGGIYRRNKEGSTPRWTSLNKGMNVRQYYRLSCSATKSDFVTAGSQDNGTWLLKNGTLDKISGSDGMESIIDYSDTAIYYKSTQYGVLFRTGGTGTFTNPPNAGDDAYCAWTTPFIVHPTNPQTLFWGAKDVYKTSDRGNTWTKISNNLTINDHVSGGRLRSMAIAPSDSKYIYAASMVKVYVTILGGGLWVDVTSNLPVSAGCLNCAAITSIAVHPDSANVVWVTLSGYASGVKVFKTTNSGSSWKNVSGNLPNYPVNTIVYDKQSNGGVYVGTDLGVYYKNNSLTTWVQFVNNLPNVPVTELEIQYQSGKLRAATFGRGLWESDLYDTAPASDLYNNAPTIAINGNPDFCTSDTALFALTLSDQNTETVHLAFSSSNQACVADSQLILTGSGASRSLKVVASKQGTSTISISMTDDEGLQGEYALAVSSHEGPVVAFAADAIICAGDTIKVEAFGAQMYEWYDAHHALVGTLQTLTIVSDAPGVYEYRVHATDVGGCTSYNTVNVPVSGLPVFTLSGDAEICNSDYGTWLYAEGAQEYEWYAEAGTLLANSSNVYYATPAQSTTYLVCGFDINGCKSQNNIAVDVLPDPGKPAIKVIHDTLFSNCPDGNNRWYRNASAIDGATENYYVFTEAGSYSVKTTTTNGCSSWSDPLHMAFASGLQEEEQGAVTSFPNPASTLLTVQFEKCSAPHATLAIYNSLGALQMETEVMIASMLHTEKIDLSQLSSGVYFLSITINGTSHLQKVAVANNQ